MPSVAAHGMAWTKVRRNFGSCKGSARGMIEKTQYLAVFVKFCPPQVTKSGPKMPRIPAAAARSGREYGSLPTQRHGTEKNSAASRRGGTGRKKIRRAPTRRRGTEKNSAASRRGGEGRKKIRRPPDAAARDGRKFGGSVRPPSTAKYFCEIQTCPPSTTKYFSAVLSGRHLRRNIFRRYFPAAICGKIFFGSTFRPPSAAKYFSALLSGRHLQQNIFRRYFPAAIYGKIFFGGTFRPPSAAKYFSELLSGRHLRRNIFREYFPAAICGKTFSGGT